MVLLHRQKAVTNLVKEHMPKNKRSLTSWLWGGSSSRQNTPKKESSAEDATSRTDEKEEDRYIMLRLENDRWAVLFCQSLIVS